MKEKGFLNYLAWQILTLLLFAGSTIGLVSAAELPELGSPSTGSGQPTSARFLGGATADGGNSYPNSFTPNEVLDILAEFRVESGHVSSLGNLYIVASADDLFYMRLEDGSFPAWDGNVATLLPTTSAIPLPAVEELSIIEGLAFADVGVSNTDIYFYLAYDTQQNPGEIYYSGEPITVTITADQVDTFQLYRDTISQAIIQEKCITCHRAGGLAGSTKLTYAQSSEPGYQQTNYDTLSNYILNEPGGSDLILSKPQGIAHGGGVVLTSKSAEFAALSQFVAAVQNNAGSGGGDAQAIFDGVDMLDNAETLRKAALLFAGRLPTEMEIINVSGEGEAELRIAVRDLMADGRFVNFLMEGANDQLLTQAYRANLFQVIDRYRYPNSRQYFRAPNFIGSDRRMTSEAIAEEPLRLIAHVVTNERPYTEILTADYIMVNPWSAEVFGGNVGFDNPTNPNEWKEGQLTEYYRCQICTRNGDLSYPNYNIPTDYPHAGILNSPAFLSRFPSTSTNRNRARARWAYYFFLGVDIEGLSERTTDPDALADENNPTLNNPNCTVCHDIMDPVAGAFQNYGDDGFFRDQPGGEHALPRSYRRDSEGLYQPGDTWYADMLTPGFKQLIAPSPDNSLQWLAEQIITDERFGTGTVNFWYSTVIGREMLSEPENPEDLDYAAKLEAYIGEQKFMQTVATDFIQGNHGNGTHNLKDLLVDLAVSSYFRARSSDSLQEDQALQLSDVGYGQLLTPEQLNRKLMETTGFEWRYGRFNTLTGVYGLVYGGIDSFGITERATDLTTMMSTVVTTMANETSCAMVAQDFGKAAGQRLLFPQVELTSLPTTHSDAIRNNIQYLHERLLGESLATDAAEVDATFNLFSETWQARIDANKGPDISSDTELCLLENTVNPVRLDPNQTLRSWAVVVNYLLRDFRFIHE